LRAPTAGAARARVGGPGACGRLGARRAIRARGGSALAPAGGVRAPSKGWSRGARAPAAQAPGFAAGLTARLPAAEVHACMHAFARGGRPGSRRRRGGRRRRRGGCRAGTGRAAGEAPARRSRGTSPAARARWRGVGRGDSRAWVEDCSTCGLGASSQNSRKLLIALAAAHCLQDNCYCYLLTRLHTVRQLTGYKTDCLKANSSSKHCQQQIKVQIRNIKTLEYFQWPVFRLVRSSSTSMR
jgi:hypothetical protein